MDQEIRWEQRFSNFVKALTKLEQAVAFIEKQYPEEEVHREDLNELLDEMIKESLIQRFEYTHELAWNVMKDYVHYQGNNQISGSRDATREAFQFKLISDGHTWMDMIASRNKTSHTYNEETANEIYSKILDDYVAAFREFKENMEAKRGGKIGEVFG